MDSQEKMRRAAAKAAQQLPLGQNPGARRSQKTCTAQGRTTFVRAIGVKTGTLLAPVGK
jgi:hypothetical protein